MVHKPRFHCEFIQLTKRHAQRKIVIYTFLFGYNIDRQVRLLYCENGLVSEIDL